MRICLLISMVRWIYLYYKKWRVHMRIKDQEKKYKFFYFSNEYSVKLIHVSDQHHGQLLHSTNHLSSNRPALQELEC